MSDLIRREDALDAFGLSEKTRKYGGDHSGYDTRMLYEIQDVLESLPSAEPERRKGEWIDTTCKHIYKCSNCGNFLDFNGVNAGRGDANFCPNCGADNRGDR